MAIVVLFVGIKGYFTYTKKLNKLSFSFSPNPENIPQVKKEEENFSSEEIEEIKSEFSTWSNFKYFIVSLIFV